MAVANILCNLLMPDMVEVYRARINLRQAWEAINQTNVQGKAAILGSLDQADDAMLDILKKGSKRAVRFALEGRFTRTRLLPGLPELMLELAPEEAAKFQGEVKERRPPGRPRRTANGRGQEVK